MYTKNNIRYNHYRCTERCANQDLLSYTDYSGCDGCCNSCKPEPPVIISPSEGEVFNEPQPLISGTAAPGNTAIVNIDGRTSYIAVNEYGSWSLKVLPMLEDGPHMMTVTQISGSFEESGESAAAFSVVFLSEQPEMRAAEQKAVEAPNEIADASDAASSMNQPDMNDPAEQDPSVPVSDVVPQQIPDAISTENALPLEDSVREDESSVDAAAFDSADDPPLIDSYDYSRISTTDQIIETINETLRCREEESRKVGLNGIGLLHFRKWWDLREVGVAVYGKMISGIPIFYEEETLRVVNDLHSYFIPIEKVDYIRTDDGLKSCLDFEDIKSKRVDR